MLHLYLHNREEVEEIVLVDEVQEDIMRLALHLRIRDEYLNLHKAWDIMSDATFRMWEVLCTDERVDNLIQRRKEYHEVYNKSSVRVRVVVCKLVCNHIEYQKIY
ncbi:hypothetical protein [Crucivirus-483]|nr:hypothetical protein [Crucivirus-483]